jgi:hypothetical protein
MPACVLPWLCNPEENVRVFLPFLSLIVCSEELRVFNSNIDFCEYLI